MFSRTFYDAKAIIKGSSKYPRINGEVYFKNTNKGVILTARINGLPINSGRFFGFHIHEGNSCTGDSLDEFKDAKTHLNLENKEHQFHTGDLPPLIECDGYSYMQVLIGKFNISDIINKVIIIHDKPDDFTTKPSGNSGNKIACGKIIRI